MPGGSLTRPDSCDSSRRIVTAPMVAGLALSDSSGIHLTAVSSRSRAPASRSCMIAVPVKVLVIDAIRYSTSGPAGWRSTRLAKPVPPDQASSSPWTMPAAAPYSRFSLTNEASLAPNSSAPAATGPAISLLSHRLMTYHRDHPIGASSCRLVPDHHQLPPAPVPRAAPAGRPAPRAARTRARDRSARARPRTPASPQS